MKRILVAIILALGLGGLPAGAECNDCPDILELMALNCPRCFGGGATGGDPDDPSDDPPPDPNRGNTVVCIANITDALGNPAPGIEVNLNTRGLFSWQDPECFCSAADCQYGEINEIGEVCDTCPATEEANPGKTCAKAFTDENGYAYLVAYAVPEWQMNYAYCEAYFPDRDPALVRHDYYDDGNRLTNDIRLVIGGEDNLPDIDFVPRTEIRELPGLDPTGTGTGSKFAGGAAYDKVLVFVPPFDPRENLGTRYSWLDWFRYYKHLLLPLLDDGYDVWLFEPADSGENIHEQASELAQLIQYAHDIQPANDDQRGEREVAVLGAFTGGLLARTALARWSDTLGNSAEWKAELGLDPQPPVRALFTMDAPLHGANIPPDIQKRLWRLNRERDLNLDACSTRQSLKAWCTDWDCGDEGYRHFFNGAGAVPPGCGSNLAVMWPRDDNGAIRGVLSLGDAGYPAGVHVMATSDGRLGERNQCYADERDENSLAAHRRDVGGAGASGRVCGGRPPRSVPVQNWDAWVQNNAEAALFNHGSLMIEIKLDEMCTAVANQLGMEEASADGEVHYWDWDAAPGSRADIQYEELVLEVMANGALDGLSDVITLFRFLHLFAVFDVIGDLFNFSPTDCGDSLGITQDGIGTAVPATSAFDIRGCQAPRAACQFMNADQLEDNGIGSHHPNIDVTCQNSHNGVQGRVYEGCRDAVLAEIDNVFAAEIFCDPGAPDFCFPVCGDEQCHVGESEDGCCLDCGDCCDNGTCEDHEDGYSCPFDCPPPECGNGQCEAYEATECCQDCGTCAQCGDGDCDPAEDHTTCPADCPPPDGGSGGCVRGVCVGQQ